MANSIEDILKDRIRSILLKWGREEVLKMQKILQSKGKIATGVLYRSLKAEVREDLNLILSMSPYAAEVDVGRKPGKMPPLAPLRRWAKIRGIPEAAVFSIAKHIKEYGTKGANFTEPFRADNEILQERLLKALGKDLLEYFKEQIEATVLVK